MKCFRKAFLFTVGVIFIAFDDLAKSVDETIKAAGEQRKKLAKQES